MKHDMPLSAALDELSRHDVPAHKEQGAIVSSNTGETIATANKHGDVSRHAVMGFLWLIS
ncbi:hypothetical protein [uncultured Ruegeria sp.]|uniref:hypothetical protein n=1 Tax=uncultured Ruegeria sp. TaxID=259304 RepID=UPI0026038F8C|nr:hypothetical protein [uncultured Ruegeria sp.]